MRIFKLQSRKNNSNLIGFLFSFFIHLAILLIAFFVFLDTPKKQISENSYKLNISKFSYYSEEKIQGSKNQDLNKNNENKEEKFQETKEEKPSPKPQIKEVKKESIIKKIVKKSVKKQIHKKEIKQTNKSQKAKNLNNKNAKEKQVKFTKQGNANYNAKASNYQVLGQKDELFLLIRKQIAKNIIYPKSARRLGQSGKISLKFTITKKGLDKNSIKLKGSFKNLEKAVLKAILKASENFPKIDKTYKLSMEFNFILH